MNFNRQSNPSAQQIRKGEELKAVRLGGEVGSKRLRYAIGRLHPEFHENMEIIFDIEYARIEITPEIEAAYRVGVEEVIAGTYPLPNLCDLCNRPTTSWLYDVCQPCILDALFKRVPTASRVKKQSNAT